MKKYEMHGMRHSAEYRSWMAMKDRCLNPRGQFFHLYGGRGISVCKRWSDSFKAFFADMGPRPSVDMSLDRIDCNGNYEPGNCRWATDTQQSRNRRGYNSIITFHGQERTVSEWAEVLGIPSSNLGWRIRSGWSAERALTEPYRIKPGRPRTVSSQVAAQ